MSYDRHLERWTVHHRAGWLNPVFEALSWMGSQGLVWLAIAAALAIWGRRPWLFLQVALADFVGQLISYGLKPRISPVRPTEVYPDPRPRLRVPHARALPS